MAGIPLHKSYNSAVVETGGYENTAFVEKNCQNYIEQVRRLCLGEEDALAIQAYFSKMQARYSGFYYSMDLDKECKLKNIFWADQRCRQSYKEFGDVVTFDTTYLTNKYDMPFVSFVGVNHHGQSILLGCGLLSNVDIGTFVWLFRTWFECMYRQAPNGIITDQDCAMKNAIEIVFPNTKHRWCLWHIMKKLLEKFGYHVHKSSIISTIHGLVYDSENGQEFEEGWKLMLDTYDLHNNDWLSGLYENRGWWVPCFLKTTFWAGMSTTQRSESMNAFFDGYVHSKTSLKQFVEQYERALRNKVEKEFQADFKSYSQMEPCATTFEIEKQFQAIYTISKFKEVKEEFTGKIYCDVITETANDSYWSTYEVREHVALHDHRKKKTFCISFRGDTCEVICSCHLFEFRGIICRHAIAVLIRNNITSMPERYIIRRWRRDVSRAYTRIAVNYDGMVSTPRQLRYDEMCQAFSELANLAANDEGWTRNIMEWIKSQAKDLRRTKSSVGSADQSQNGSSNANILDSISCNRKGASKKLRRKNPLESSSKRVKAATSSSKGKRPTARHSNTEERAIDVQAAKLPQCSMPMPLQYFICPTPANVVVNAQGLIMPYFYTHLPNQGGKGL